jgi:hypothetical protein
MPQIAHEHESDVRWIHSHMQAFLQYAGSGVMVPVTAFATLAAAVQAWQRGYDVVAVFVVMGAAILLVMATLVAAPAARGVCRTKTYEDDLDAVALPLFRLARMHHTMLLGLIPLTLAQLALLFY